MNVSHWPRSKSYSSWFSLFIRLALRHSLDKGRPYIPCISLLGFIAKCSIQPACTYPLLVIVVCRFALQIRCIHPVVVLLKKMEWMRLTFIQDYLYMSNELSPWLRHTILLLLALSILFIVSTGTPVQLFCWLTCRSTFMLFLWLLWLLWLLWYF